MNLQRVRGDTYNIKATLKVNSTPVDLRLCTIKFSYINEETREVRTIIGTGTEAGEATFNPSTGDFQNVGLYSYDIEVTMQNGEKTTFIIGKLNIIDDITK